MATNRLWGGSDVALMWLWGGFGLCQHFCFLLSAFCFLFALSAFRFHPSSLPQLSAFSPAWLWALPAFLLSTFCFLLSLRPFSFQVSSLIPAPAFCFPNLCFSPVLQLPQPARYLRDFRNYQDQPITFGRGGARDSRRAHGCRPPQLAHNNLQGAHPDTTTKAGGYANRNAGFIRQPQCGSPACRMNPAFRWWCQEAPVRRARGVVLDFHGGNGIIPL